MRTATLLPASLLAAAALIAQACTGNDEDSPPTPGSGGAGGGEAAASVCYRACEASIALGCPIGPLEDCVAECLGIYTMEPSCAAELTAYYECEQTERVDCGAEPPACQQAFERWEICATGGCAGASCTGMGDACTCDAECHGEPVTVECAPAPEGGVACACLVKGAEVGTCQQQGPACFPPESCCAPLLGL